MIRKRIAALLCLPLLSIATVVVNTTTAQAAVGDMLCLTSSFQINFFPPLNGANLDTDVYATGHLATCVSPNGNYANLLSANIEAPGEATASPLFVNPCQLVLTINGTGQFVWTKADGTHVNSTIEWVINTNPFNGQLTMTAEITGGPMDGDSAVAIPLLAYPNVDCALTGLRTLTAPLVIVPFG